MEASKNNIQPGELEREMKICDCIIYIMKMKERSNQIANTNTIP